MIPHVERKLTVASFLVRNELNSCSRTLVATLDLLDDPYPWLLCADAGNVMLLCADAGNVMPVFVPSLLSPLCADAGHVILLCADAGSTLTKLRTFD